MIDVADLVETRLEPTVCSLVKSLTIAACNKVDTIGEMPGTSEANGYVPTCSLVWIGEGADASCNYSK